MLKQCLPHMTMGIMRCVSVSKCMCVCVCVLCVSVCAYMCIFVIVCMYVCTCAHVCVCLYEQMYVQVLCVCVFAWLTNVCVHLPSWSWLQSQEYCHHLMVGFREPFLLCAVAAVPNKTNKYSRRYYLYTWHFQTSKCTLHAVIWYHSYHSSGCYIYQYI